MTPTKALAAVLVLVLVLLLVLMLLLICCCCCVMLAEAIRKGARKWLHLLCNLQLLHTTAHYVVHIISAALATHMTELGTLLLCGSVCVVLLPNNAHVAGSARATPLLASRAHH
jgi:uncharacterized membrane protein YgdD (TMEM256/DUF423 family)